MSLYVKALQRFLVTSAGLAFDPEQMYLAESRLLPVAQRCGFKSVNSLVGELNLGDNAELAQAAVEAMTTHETFFFRDRSLFDLISAIVLPNLRKARSDTRKIRIWCAACSTGQEPYSLAMLLDEQARSFAGWNVEILATDISHTAVAVARKGVYSQFEVQRGLPVQHLLRYFQPDGEGWRLSEHLRARVEFRQNNLIHDFTGLGRFDLILCRNVLMYFDVAKRGDVLARLGARVNDGGYLALGASERIADAAPGVQQILERGVNGAVGMKPHRADHGKVVAFPKERAYR